MRRIHCMECGSPLETKNYTENSTKYYCGNCDSIWFKSTRIITEWTKMNDEYGMADRLTKAYEELNEALEEKNKELKARIVELESAIEELENTNGNLNFSLGFLKQQIEELEREQNE